MATLGEELRREREQRAVALKDIADKTKINLRNLEALEGGRYEHLLEPFFIKGILRIYAKFLDLPEDHFLAKYREEAGPDVEAEAKKAAPDFLPEKRKRAPRRRLRRTVAVGPALFILALLAAATIFLLKPMRNRTPVVPALSTTAPAAVSPPAVPIDWPPVLDSGAIDEGADLRLELTFTAETWIHVAADRAIQLDGIKKPGDTAVCTARKEFILQTGNAAGFAFTLNGRPGKPLGASGAVMTDVRINRETLAGFLAAPANRPAGKQDR
jgi:cytoskeletal protein RodZ